MKKPTALLAALPVVLALTVPAARAAHDPADFIEKKLHRLAEQVADGARDVYRSAAGRYGHRDRYPGHGFDRRQREQTLRLLHELEHQARTFERALAHHPAHQTHREFEALTRGFERAAWALSRTRVGWVVVRDFDRLAEAMYALRSYYEEHAYPRRVRLRGYDGGPRNRVESYGPRWNVDLEWPRRGGHDHDEDSDSD